VPTWFKSTPEQVVDNICKLAKKGATPSQIGVVLRDSHGVAQVKVVTGMNLSNFVGGPLRACVDS
jgi:small subunit ribosomal protein S13e